MLAVRAYTEVHRATAFSGFDGAFVEMVGVELAATVAARYSWAGPGRATENTMNTRIPIRGRRTRVISPHGLPYTRCARCRPLSRTGFASGTQPKRATDPRESIARSG